MNIVINVLTFLFRATFQSASDEPTTRIFGPLSHQYQYFLINYSVNVLERDEEKC